jgi:AraC-like DNA-binding protein
MEYAKRLLLESDASDRSMLSISVASGFPSESSFFHTFKSIEGVSPKTWQEKCKE